MSNFFRPCSRKMHFELKQVPPKRSLSFKHTALKTLIIRFKSIWFLGFGFCYSNVYNYHEMNNALILKSHRVTLFLLCVLCPLLSDCKLYYLLSFHPLSQNSSSLIGLICRLHIHHTIPSPWLWVGRSY